MTSQGISIEVDRGDLPPASGAGTAEARALRVLVVEDDVVAAADIVRGLKGEGFAVELATSSRDAARCMASNSWDAVVVDLMLAGGDGFDVLARARSRVHAALFALSERTDLSDRLRAFELGAADFLPKPFWIEELVARIRARLRVPSEPSKRTVSWSSCVLDLDAHAVAIDGRAVALTPTEFSVLAFLVERRGRAVSRSALASQALASVDRPDSRTVDSHVARLRRKLGPGAEAITTVWGIGYRFERIETSPMSPESPPAPPGDPLGVVDPLGARDVKPGADHGLGHGVTFRNAREDDFPAVTEAIRDWWTMPGFDSANAQRERAALLPKLWLEHFASTSFIAERGRTMAGFLVGFHSPDRADEAFVHFVGVSPLSRKGGIGRALYERFFGASRSQGRTQVRCVTSPGNRDSIAFHLAMGFRVEPGTEAVDGVAVQANYGGVDVHRVGLVRAL